jgi:hypothetical protein
LQGPSARATACRGGKITAEIGQPAALAEGERARQHSGRPARAACKDQAPEEQPATKKSAVNSGTECDHAAPSTEAA